MFKSLLLASLGLGLLAAAAQNATTPATTPATPPRPKQFDCGTNTQHADSHFLDTIKGLHQGGNNNGGSPAQRAKRNELLARAKDNNTAITVDAVFHIVAKPSNKDDISNDMPQAQIDALNTAYKDYGISFNLINVTWTQNDKWAVGATDDDTAMKKALRQGTYRTLNLYFQTDLSGGVLGRCSLPSNVANGKNDPSVYYSDGCNVNANTMPDGPMDGYNSGMTAVHETGHWMGLLHTFEGNSCDGPGDYIDDTPYEKESTDGCPTDPPKRTCPNQKGSDTNDPIHNYMDYSTDACYQGFTQLQKERMHYMYNLYRDGN
ncbi:hypothetical protein SLS60_005948 [Paraconiothyrium brasiliense]|uniref:Peptidase M43 pregnancy-associated plasma-A domain-containing protein n=1 Tax=Paraconiothyrium brasiliense TaxID=300254 RepID=A0ABR3RF87_9PLEO